MRSKLFALGVVVALAGGGGGVGRVDSQPLRAGQSLEVTAKTEMVLTVDVKANGKVLVEFEMPARIELAFVASVETADEEGCTLGALAFGKCEEMETDSFGGRPTTRTPGYSAATFAVTRQGERLLARREEGSIADHHQKVVDGLAEATLRAPALGEMLRSRSLEKGTPITLYEEDAQRVLHVLTSDTKAQSMTLTFEEMRKQGDVEAARFKVATKLATASDDGFPFDVTIDLTGEILLAKEGGQVLSMQLTGPVRMTGKVEEDGIKGELDGNGTWTIEWRAVVR